MSDTPAPGQQLGEYTLIELLQRGPFDEAWLARLTDDEDDAEVVVIKVATHPLTVQWMADQQTFAIDVDHDNLLLANEVNFSEMPPYLVYDHVPGESLADLVTAGIQFDQRGVLALVRQVAAAVAALHRAGEFHGLLTPDHVRLAETGEVLVLETETARIIRDIALLVMRSPAAPPELSRILPFLAPEEQAQAGRTDVRADVYSIGLLYYYLLTLHRPDEAGISEADLAGQPIQVQALILECIAPLEGRLANAGELLDRLDRIKALLPAPANDDEYDEEDEYEEEGEDAIAADEAASTEGHVVEGEPWFDDSGEYITAD
jgi:serine/threonine protein kinase